MGEWEGGRWEAGWEWKGGRLEVGGVKGAGGGGRWEAGGLRFGLVRSQILRFGSIREQAVRYDKTRHRLASQGTCSDSSPSKWRHFAGALWCTHLQLGFRMQDSESLQEVQSRCFKAVTCSEFPERLACTVRSA